ncbi:MAG TPA: hypothetical protein DCY35_10835 [Prolixibacteraceae bacterium]|nr:hypothetical protein [Prolixibacteraceae bacterium]
MSPNCIFCELNEEGTPWGNTDPERMWDLIRRYNDKAEIVVGKRILQETVPPPQDSKFPSINSISEIFGGKHINKNGVSWLMSDMKSPRDLELALDRIDSMNLREYIFPWNWEQEKRRIYEKYGLKPVGFFGIRGPVTLAMSLFGVENLIFLINDEPDLAARFRDTIIKLILFIWREMSREAGYSPGEEPRKFSFYDDNCAMLTAEMYEFFGYPILKKVFDICAPNDGDIRYQHSDSDMGHLLPVLSKLNFTGVNFGPNVLVQEIRKHMPKTRIDGQISPFTLMRNEEENLIKETKRDCEGAKNFGRGVNLTTAGGVNNGSLLTSMRAIMFAIQEFGQY